MALFGRKKDKEKEDAKVQEAIAADAALVFSENDIAKARKWFVQAKKLTEDRNYDYAIESYLSGLKFWPEAVDEGHIPLRVASFARWEKGGKKPTTLEAMKHPMSGKDAVQALLNAEWLWSREPNNVSYMEGMVKNAGKAKCEQALLFIGPIYFEAIKSEKKLNKNRFELLKDIYEEVGNRCERRGDLSKALLFFQGALTVLQALQSISTQSLEYTQALTDLATKVTIIKGKYDAEGDFRKSVKDADAQKEIHDRERMVLEEGRLEQLIAEARNEWKANPMVSSKLIKLVDLLCRDEQPDREEEAAELLDSEYTSSKNYSFKMRADDIRQKQYRREVRAAVAEGHKEAAQQAKLELLKFELKMYKERLANYPTDNRIKFEYGKCLIQARKYDEAIPLLQEARNDPKNRIACMNLIGRCFFEKGFYSQAVATYNQAIGEYELTGDDLSKELYYWLGRTTEAAGKFPEAEKAYGQIIQWDYNYKDVKGRLEAIESQKSS